jgi:hypothetical protein
MGKKEESIDEKILKFIYINAIRDAVRQKAYNGEKKFLEDEKLVDELIEIMNGILNKVLNGKFSDQETFDKEFLGTLIKICDKVNKEAGNREFTFGNAQKLVNMLFKYFYIKCYNEPNLKSNFSFCHCPMDSRLLENVWNERKKIKELNNWTRNDFLDSWGKENFEEDKKNKKQMPNRYIVFQKAVKELAKESKLANSIDYDFVIWN